MSRRSAMWGAAALSLVLMLLFSAVLLQPTLGSSGNAAGSESGMTVDASSAVPGDDATWEEDEDEDDDEDRYEEHEGGEDEDGGEGDD